MSPDCDAPHSRGAAQTAVLTPISGPGQAPGWADFQGFSAAFFPLEAARAITFRAADQFTESGLRAQYHTMPLA